jgi:anti-anti-sigma factor
MSILELNVERGAGFARLALKGELDLAGAGRVDEAVSALLAGDDHAMLIVDLRELTFMDSTGLRAIVRAHEAAQQAGRRVAIVRGPEAVHRVFELVGMADRLELVDEPPQP